MAKRNQPAVPGEPEVQPVSSPDVVDVAENGGPADNEAPAHIEPATDVVVPSPGDLTPPAVSEKVKCAVLLDCIYGKHDDIIDLDAAEADAAYAAGYVDTHPNAIKALEG